MAGKKNSTIQVFVSSSSPDAKWVTELVRALQKRGVRTWTVTQDVKAGASLDKELRRGLRESDYVVAVADPKADEGLDPSVAFEIGAALAMGKQVYVVGSGARAGKQEHASGLLETLGGVTKLAKGGPVSTARTLHAALEDAA